MKPSNSDLEDLWQGIADTHEQKGRRIPLCLRAARRAYSVKPCAIPRKPYD